MSGARGAACASAGPLRVLALVPGDSLSGPAAQVVSTARQLSERGVALRVAMLSRSSPAHGRFLEILESRGILHSVIKDRHAFDIRTISAVRALTESWRPDILETHGYKATAIALAVRRLDPSLRWVGFFHGLTTESRRARLYHWLDRQMLRWADCAVAVSEEQRRSLLRSARNARVITSAVTLLQESSDTGLSEAEPLRLDGALRPRIGVVGRLSPEKGVDVFIEAMSILAAQGCQFSAVVAGDGPERPRLERLARERQVAGRTSFLGHISRMKELYSQLDLLVIPSRSEGLPSVLLEALDADTPVVATRVGAIPDVLQPFHAGTLVEPEAPQQLANAILEALSSGRSESASRARAATARRYSQPVRAEALVGLYRELRADRESRPSDPHDHASRFPEPTAGRRETPQ